MGQFTTGGGNSSHTPDMMLDIALGNRTGMSHINKFGRNADVDTASDPEDAWSQGGLWVPPTAARTHDIASTSANDAGALLSTGSATGGSTTTIEDTGATFVSDGVTAGDVVLNDTSLEHSVVVSATETVLTCHDTRHGANLADSGDTYRVVDSTSTGASIVHIYGLIADMTTAQEFVIMNGTTNVPTVNTYWRINRIHTDGAGGRTVTNVGTVTATAQTDGTVTSSMMIGAGSTLQAIYTVPKGKTAVMTNLYASINKSGGASSARADLTLRETSFASIDGAGSRVDHYFGVSIGGTSNYQHFFHPYKHFEEQTDIWIRIDSVSSNDSDVSAGFDLILIDN